MTEKHTVSEDMKWFMDPLNLYIKDGVVYRKTEAGDVSTGVNATLDHGNEDTDIETMIMIKLLSDELKNKIVLPFNVETKNNRIYTEDSFANKEKQVDLLLIHNAYEYSVKDICGRVNLQYREEGVFIDSVKIIREDLHIIPCGLAIILHGYSPYLGGVGEFNIDGKTIYNYTPKYVNFCQTSKRSF